MRNHFFSITYLLLNDCQCLNISRINILLLRFFFMMLKNLCVEGFLCASVVGCRDLGDKDVSVVKGAVLRVGRISGLPGHCLGSMRSTSSSGSRSRSTELMTGGWPGSTPDSEPLTASLKSSLFAVLLAQPEVALTAPTRSICSPSIAFKVAGGYQVMLHDSGYDQQLSKKIHHMSGYDCTIRIHSAYKVNRN